MRRRAALALVLAALSLSWALGSDRLMIYRWGAGVNEDLYPVAASDFIDRNDLPGRLYNNYGDGSYLIYRLYPKLGVFQDGRLQAYPREFIARPNGKLSPGDWPKLLEEYGVNTALVSPLQRSYLFRSAQWATLYWDDEWCVLLRRLPAQERLIDRLEYRLFLPGAEFMAVGDPPGLSLLEKEMARNQRERLEPSAVVATNRAIVLRRLGRDADALEELERAVDHDPRYAPAWANIGSLRLARGEVEGARAAFMLAHRLDPGLEGLEGLLRALP